MKPEYRYRHCFFYTKWAVVKDQFLGYHYEPTDRLVSGYQINNSRLHVYAEKPNHWDIIHVPTGLAAKCGISRFKEACQIAHEILPLTNWEVDTAEEFTAQDNRALKDYFGLPYSHADRRFAVMERIESGLANPYNKTYVPHDKVQYVADAEGYKDPWDMLMALLDKSAVPSICMNEDCNYYDTREPDCNKGYCPECNEWTLKSVFAIEGVI